MEPHIGQRPIANMATAAINARITSVPRIPAITPIPVPPRLGLVCFTCLLPFADLSSCSGHAGQRLTVAEFGDGQARKPLNLHHQPHLVSVELTFRFFFIFSFILSIFC